MKFLTWTASCFVVLISISGLQGMADDERLSDLEAHSSTNSPFSSSPLRYESSASPPTPVSPAFHSDSSPSDDNICPRRKRYKYAESTDTSNPLYWPPDESLIDEAQQLCSPKRLLNPNNCDGAHRFHQIARLMNISSDEENDGNTPALSESEKSSSSSSESSAISGSDISDRSLSDQNESFQEESEPLEGASDIGNDSLSDSILTVSKVFSGSNLLVDEGVLHIMEVFMKHNLNKTVTGDILDLVLKFLPEHHNMPSSKHLLFQYVESLCPVSRSKCHFYCSQCLLYIGEESGNCRLCNGECKKFFQLSLSEQIKNLFENHQLSELLDQYTAERAQSLSSAKYSDICEGQEFKKARNKINGPYDLVLLGHSDGLSISESSNATFWPLEFVIANLPFHLRFKFVLISGLWLDNVKPYMNCYLKPFALELKFLFETGVKWIHPKTGREHISKVCAPGFCADAPVRSDIQNIMSHNGRYSCNNCEQKTVRIPFDDLNPQQKRKRVFTFQEQLSPLRTDERMKLQGECSLRDIKRAGSSKPPHKGVKGRSVVSRFPECDRGSVVFPEYMHILLGVIRVFMALWFETSAKDPWSLKPHVDDISLMLESIRVPDFITRIPRSINCYKKWKANECRSFLLYYSLVIFSRFMKPEYFQHWILLVNALFLLLQDCVLESDIQRAELYIRMFLRDFHKLYRSKDFTYNLHNLLHLGLTVRRWGPLWSNSAFPFENFNGYLSRCIHGTKNQGQELVNNIRLILGVQALKARVEYNNTISAFSSHKVEFRNCVNRELNFNSNQKSALSSSSLQFPVTFYYRALVKGQVFTSNIYRRQEKRNNYTVCFVNEKTGSHEYGEICCYCESADRQLKMILIQCFGIVHLRNFTHIASRTVVDHIIPVASTERFQLVLPGNILYKVIRVGSFVCLRPNKYEKNL